MDEMKLFLKYNMVPTSDMKKGKDLIEQIRSESIVWDTSTNRDQILLLLHGSYNCNLNCIYCENQHLRHAYKGKVMDEDLVREIIFKLKDHLREVTWHGGEALLLPKSLIVALEEEKSRYGLEFITSLQTNSLLLDEEMIKFLDKYDINFGTSFDGLKNTNSRGLKSTESILRCIEKFPQRIGFICVTYKDTIDDIIDNYEYFKSLGVKGMQSCIVRENVIEESNPYLVKNEVAIPKMIEYIDYWIHDRDKPLYDSYVVRFIERLLGAIHLCEDIDCIGGWLIVDPLGNIGFCGHNLLEDSIVNIRDIESYHDIITHPKYLKAVAAQKRLLKSCQSCTWYNVCNGACMGLNYEYDHSYKHISPRNCEYTHGVLKGIYELIKDIDITRTDLYNPLFLELLKKNNYYSLTEIIAIEEEYGDGKYSDKQLL